MKTLIVLAILAVVALIGFFVIKSRQKSSSNGAPWPFYVKKPLTQPEQILYHRLAKALPEHIVMAQVQVSRVLGVKKGSNFNEWNNRINRLSYDFVVCSKDSTPIAAIELDDSTHTEPTRVATDDKKTKATVDAGLRLIRWNVKSMPDEAAIQRELSAEHVKTAVTK
jgi:hypothetical protein